MSEEILRVGLRDVAQRLKESSDLFVVLFRRGDFSAELYSPKEVDLQHPHEQDEVYIVASGSGVFMRGDERVPFVPGDFLFVPAGVVHRFEEFTSDFSTWVLFFGPKKSSEIDG